MLIFRHESDGDLDQRIHQEISDPCDQGSQTVVKPGRRQGKQEAERQHDKGRPMETRRQKHNPADGQVAARSQKRPNPQDDRRGKSLTQEIHAQGEMLESEEQEYTHPGGGGISPDPYENQSGQQEMEHKQENAVAASEKGNRQIQEQITRFRPVRPSQSRLGNRLKSSLIKAVVKSSNIPKRGQKPTGCAQYQQISPPVLGPMVQQRRTGETRTNHPIIRYHGRSPHTNWKGSAQACPFYHYVILEVKTQGQFTDTLFEIDEKGLAVMQQRFDPKTKSTFWTIAKSVLARTFQIL